MASSCNTCTRRVRAAQRHGRLVRVEEEARKDLESRETLYCPIAYKFLNALGMRMATIESDIHRELEK